jgi:hypothetical protein
VTADVKRQIRRMSAEIMRDIGVLLIVFAPLDAIFDRRALTVMWIAGIVVVAVVFIVGGIAAGLER